MTPKKVQALLQPFKNVTVIYGHVHQIQYNQIGNISLQFGDGDGLALALSRHLCAGRTRMSLC